MHLLPQRRIDAVGFDHISGVLDFVEHLLDIGQQFIALVVSVESPMLNHPKEMDFVHGGDIMGYGCWKSIFPVILVLSQVDGERKATQEMSWTQDVFGGFILACGHM